MLFAFPDTGKGRTKPWWAVEKILQDTHLAGTPGIIPVAFRRTRLLGGSPRMTQPRSTLVSLDDTPWYHVVSRWEPLRNIHLAP